MLNDNTSVKNVSPSGEFGSLCWHEDLSKAELTDVEVVVIDQREQTRGPSLKNIWLMPKYNSYRSKLLFAHSTVATSVQMRVNVICDTILITDSDWAPIHLLGWQLLVSYCGLLYHFMCHFLLQERNANNYAYKIQFKQGSVSRGTLRFVATNKQRWYPGLQLYQDFNINNINSAPIFTFFSRLGASSSKCSKYLYLNIEF